MGIAPGGVAWRGRMKLGPFVKASVRKATPPMTMRVGERAGMNDRVIRRRACHVKTW